MDIGFLSENLYLAAEAMRVGACAVSGFAQGQVDRLLGIHGMQEIALLLITVGDVGRPLLSSI
jgi:nitroreductase